GQYQQAQTEFEKIVAQQPENLKALERLGDIHCLFKDWESGMKYYKRLKKIQPSEATYHYKYGGALGMYAKECNKFKALGLIGEIRESFENAIALNPKHLEARWALIELYLQLPGVVGGSENKAQRYASELESLSVVDGYLAKGRIAEYFDRFMTAEKYYKRAVEVGRSKICYQKLADLYKNKMNKPEKARATWAEFSNKNKS